MSDWPIVAANDDGVRPAGRPDECLYCRQRVGEPHGPECVIVHKVVEHKVTATILWSGRVVTGTWRFEEPHSWDADMSEFHKNESSWCCSNFLDEEDAGSVEWDGGEDPWKELSAAYVNGDCLCGVLRFSFVRVVDPTPTRKLKPTATN